MASRTWWWSRIGKWSKNYARAALLPWLAMRPIKDVTSVPGFYGVFGFVAFGLAVLSGLPLGHALRRPEDYYERRSGEAGRDD